MVSLVKNQHFVPRSYLKYFADSQEQVYVFDKEKQKPFKANVKNVASQRFFYDLPLELLPEAEQLLEDPQIIEHFFSNKIEGPFLRILNSIRARFVMSMNPYKITAITPQEKNQLSILLTYQYIRTRDFRETLLDGQQLVMQVLTDKLASFEIEGYEPGSITVIRNKDYDSVKHAQFMFNPDSVHEFVKIFNNHIWIILVNNTDLPFFTSDTPLVKKGHFGEHGITSSGIEINFPISNRLCLSIIDREAFKELGYFKENRFMKLVDKEHVKYLNWLQVSVTVK
jgi:hypothetical protein